MPHGGYSLIIDDDTLAFDFILPALTADSYIGDIHNGAIRYQRIQLERNGLP